MWLYRPLNPEFYLKMLLIQIKIMPTSPEVNMGAIKEKAKKIVESYGERILKEEIQPIAFGLNALLIILTWPDNKNADELEEKLNAIEEVNSAEIVDVRKAIG